MDQYNIKTQKTKRCISYTSNGNVCTNNAKYDVNGYCVCGKHYLNFYITYEDKINGKSGRTVIKEKEAEMFLENILKTNENILNEVKQSNENILKTNENVLNEVKQSNENVLNEVKISNEQLLYNYKNQWKQILEEFDSKIMVLQKLSIENLMIFLNNMYLRQEIIKEEVLYIVDKLHPSCDLKLLEFTS